jgi:MFS superfamily sulfate permease-like transporter
VLDEGYDPAAFHQDATAALTVAVVALPLSMAIAVDADRYWGASRRRAHSI